MAKFTIDAGVLATPEQVAAERELEEKQKQLVMGVMNFAQQNNKIPQPLSTVTSYQGSGPQTAMPGEGDFGSVLKKDIVEPVTDIGKSVASSVTKGVGSLYRGTKAITDRGLSLTDPLNGQEIFSGTNPAEKLVGEIETIFPEEWSKISAKYPSITEANNAGEVLHSIILSAADNSGPLLTYAINPVAGFVSMFGTESKGFEDGLSNTGFQFDDDIRKDMRDAYASISAVIEQFQTISRLNKFKGIETLKKKGLKAAVKSLTKKFGDIGWDGMEEFSQNTAQNYFTALAIKKQMERNPKQAEAYGKQLRESSMWSGGLESFLQGMGLSSLFGAAGAVKQGVQQVASKVAANEDFQEAQEKIFENFGKVKDFAVDEAGGIGINEDETNPKKIADALGLKYDGVQQGIGEIPTTDIYTENKGKGTTHQIPLNSTFKEVQKIINPDTGIKSDEEIIDIDELNKIPEIKDLEELKYTPLQILRKIDGEEIETTKKQEKMAITDSSKQMDRKVIKKANQESRVFDFDKMNDKDARDVLMKKANNILNDTKTKRNRYTVRNKYEIKIQKIITSDDSNIIKNDKLNELKIEVNKIEKQYKYAKDRNLAEDRYISNYESPIPGRNMSDVKFTQYAKTDKKLRKDISDGIKILEKSKNNANSETLKSLKRAEDAYNKYRGVLSKETFEDYKRIMRMAVSPNVDLAEFNVILESSPVDTDADTALEIDDLVLNMQRDALGTKTSASPITKNILNTESPKTIKNFIDSIKLFLTGKDSKPIDDVSKSTLKEKIKISKYIKFGELIEVLISNSTIKFTSKSKNNVVEKSFKLPKELVDLTDKEIIKILKDNKIVIPEAVIKKTLKEKIVTSFSAAYNGIVNERNKLEKDTVAFWQESKKRGIKTRIEQNAALLFNRFQGWRNIVIGKVFFDVMLSLDKAFLFEYTNSKGKKKTTNLSRDIALYTNQLSEIFGFKKIGKKNLTKKKIVISVLNNKFFKKYGKEQLIKTTINNQTVFLPKTISDTFKKLATVVDELVFRPSLESGLINKSDYNMIKNNVFLTSEQTKKLFNAEGVGIDKLINNAMESETYTIAGEKIPTFESYLNGLITAQTFAEEQNRVKQAYVNYAEFNDSITKSKIETPQTISIIKEGKKQFYNVDVDIKNLLETSVSSLHSVDRFLIKLATAPAKVIRATATGLRPLFLIKNIVRDQLGAPINSRFVWIPALSSALVMAKITASSAKHAITGKSKGPTFSQFWETWLKSGGGASYFTTTEAALSRRVESKKGLKSVKGLSIKERIKNKAAELTGKKVAQEIASTPLLALSAIERASQASEFITRATAFYNQLEFNMAKEMPKKVPIERNLFNWRDVITNPDFEIFDRLNLLPLHESLRISTQFARRGAAAVMKGITKAIPFSNAAIQGTTQGVENLVTGDSLWYLEDDQKAFGQKHKRLRQFINIGSIATGVTFFWMWNNSPSTSDEEEKVIEKFDNIIKKYKGKTNPSKIRFELLKASSNSVRKQIKKLETNKRKRLDNQELKWALSVFTIGTKEFPRKMAYQAIPTWDKYNNICVVKLNPVRYSASRKTYLPNYWKIPINDYPKLIKLVAEGYLDWREGNPPNMMNTSLELASEFTPISWSSATTLLLLKPIDEILNNVNSFSGSSIENKSLRAMEKSLLPGRKTTIISDFLAKAGILSSPQIQNIISTVGPGLGTDATKQVNRIYTALKMKKYKNLRPKDIGKVVLGLSTDLYSAVFESSSNSINFKYEVRKKYRELNALYTARSQKGYDEISKELHYNAEIPYNKNGIPPLDWSNELQKEWIQKSFEINQEADRRWEKNSNEQKEQIQKIQKVENEIYAMLVKSLIILTSVDAMNPDSVKDLQIEETLK